MLGLQKDTHEFYAKIHEIREKYHQEKNEKQGLGIRKNKSMVAFKDAGEKEFYSEAIKVYFNRKITEVILILFEGLIYFF